SLSFEPYWGLAPSRFRRRPCRNMTEWCLVPVPPCDFYILLLRFAASICGSSGASCSPKTGVWFFDAAGQCIKRESKQCCEKLIDPSWLWYRSSSYGRG